MSVPGTLSTVLHAALGDARDIAGAVREVTGPRGLAGLARQPVPKALEPMAMPLTEVLQNILDFSGAQDPDCAAVELWVEPSLVVHAVRFAGPAFPDSLIADCDRGEPPAERAPPGDSGWGLAGGARGVRQRRPEVGAARQPAVPGKAALRRRRIACRP